MLHEKVYNIRAKAIRKGSWKYVNDYAHKSEGLYNLKDDMAEKNNLRQRKPAKAKELIELLEKWEKEVSIVPGKRNGVRPLSFSCKE